MDNSCDQCPFKLGCALLDGKGTERPHVPAMYAVVNYLYCYHHQQRTAVLNGRLVIATERIAYDGRRK